MYCKSRQEISTEFPNGIAEVLAPVVLTRPYHSESKKITDDLAWAARDLS